ncbi:hypothetical protein GACE_2120 [Geoglobus acetivorans]|uniref:Uncharacterized protein n=1 Tax=Geoglobus acetivorans TaxID=565033 RepID=A0A0A7GJN7_GEOAI|nr:hypothetical protein GACE_2120 [Geoglobus acetivorans]
MFFPTLIIIDKKVSAFSRNCLIQPYEMLLPSVTEKEVVQRNLNIAEFSTVRD